MNKIPMSIDDAVEFYCESDEELGFEHRGYPACVGHLNGVVAIADDTGENGSSLEMYDAATFLEWMTEAKALFESGECDTKREAVNEVRRDAAVQGGH